MHLSCAAGKTPIPLGVGGGSWPGAICHTHFKQFDEVHCVSRTRKVFSQEGGSMWNQTPKEDQASLAMTAFPVV
jgi:hypothetical protein